MTHVSTHLESLLDALHKVVAISREPVDSEDGVVGPVQRITTSLCVNISSTLGIGCLLLTA